MTGKTILAFVGCYRPGYKAGGILRSVENAVNHLHRDFQFRIVTRDRDIGDEVSYPNHRPDDWHAVGHAKVYYLPPEGESLARLSALERGTPHDLIRLNSFFDPLTIKVLVNRRLGRGGKKPIVLCPFGEFAPAALKQKSFKKRIFMWLARLTKLHQPVTWHASSQFEADDIVRAMGIARSSIRVAVDLPAVYDSAHWDGGSDGGGAVRDGLRIVFLSRIVPNKNLDVALRILCEVRTKVAFDIIGPLENSAYWARCQKLIRALPSHVTARSIGSITPAEVMSTLSRYDLLLLPTGGESYGHVIEESLIAGTPVLISTNTPWRNLEGEGLGWDLPLDDFSSFVRVIDTLGDSDEALRSRQRRLVKERMRRVVTDGAAVAATRAVYREALGARSDG